MSDQDTVMIYTPSQGVLPRDQQPRGGAVLHVQDLQDRSREWARWHHSVEDAQRSLRLLAESEGGTLDDACLHVTLIPGEPAPLRRAWIERRHSTQIEADGPRTVIRTHHYGDRVTIRRWSGEASIMVTEQGRSATAALTLEEAAAIASALLGNR